MNELDRKLNDYFTGYVLRKDLVKQVSSNAAGPSYVLEYLLGQTNEPHDIERNRALAAAPIARGVGAFAGIASSGTAFAEIGTSGTAVASLLQKPANDASLVRKPANGASQLAIPANAFPPPRCRRPHQIPATAERFHSYVLI